MKTTTFSAATVVVLTFLLAANCFAQRGMKRNGSGGWGTTGTYNSVYDLKTVETILGEVVSVDSMTFGKGMPYGIHVVVKTDEETISVHLGPAWYIQNQDTQIQIKDVIQVRGSRISFGGPPALIAAEVKDGKGILKLRNDSDIPVWSGWKSR